MIIPVLDHSGQLSADECPFALAQTDACAQTEQQLGGLSFIEMPPISANDLVRHDDEVCGPLSFDYYILAQLSITGQYTQLMLSLGPSTDQHAKVTFSSDEKPSLTVL